MKKDEKSPILHPSDIPERPDIFDAYKKASSNDFLTFVRGLTIDSAYGPRFYDDIIQLYQLRTFEAMAPSLHAVRDGTVPDMRRFWIERTKKGSKDLDMSIALIWLLTFPVRPSYYQVGAADRDQAAIVKARMEHILFYNPWLNEHIEIIQWEVRHKTKLATLDIMAADIGGSHGHLPDLLFVNELVHVQKWEFIQNLLSNAAGAPKSMIVVATNAGERGTKAWVMRENAIQSKDWSCHIRAKPAPWISEQDLQNERAMDPSNSRFKRLWMGVWVSGKGDAVDEEDIDACFATKIRPHRKRNEGWRYIAGLDLGITRDHSALVVLAVHLEVRSIQLAHMRFWEPHGGEIDLTQVRSECLAVNEMYGGLEGGLWYDPYQAKLLKQDLEVQGVPCFEMTFSSSTNLTAMASSFVEVLRDGTLKCWDTVDGRLRRDFGKFSIVPKGEHGLKLDATRDEYGHADVGTALVICLPQAINLLSGNMMRIDTDSVLAIDDDSPLTKAEVEAMPKALRDIYEDGEGIEEHGLDDEDDQDILRDQYLSGTSWTQRNRRR